jgi:hypothetical protein
MVASSVSQPSVAAASLAAVPAVPAATPVAAPVEQAPVPPSAAPPAPVQAIIRLVGLPDGAQATLDGAPVGREFPLQTSEAKHTLRVVARGCKPFVHEFSVASDLEVWVSLEREPGAALRPAPSRVPPAVPAIGPGTAHRHPLANPFGIR